MPEKPKLSPEEAWEDIERFNKAAETENLPKASDYSRLEDVEAAGELLKESGKYTPVEHQGNASDETRPTHSKQKVELLPIHEIPDVPTKSVHAEEDKRNPGRFISWEGKKKGDLPDIVEGEFTMQAGQTYRIIKEETRGRRNVLIALAPEEYEKRFEARHEAFLRVITDRIFAGGLHLVLETRVKPPKEFSGTFEHIVRTKGNGEDIYRLTFDQDNLPDVRSNLFARHNIHRIGIDTRISDRELERIERHREMYGAYWASIAERDAMKEQQLLPSRVERIEDVKAPAFGSYSKVAGDFYPNAYDYRSGRDYGNVFLYILQKDEGEQRLCALIIPEAIEAEERTVQGQDDFEVFKEGRGQLIDIETGEVLVNDIPGQWDKFKWTTYGSYGTFGSGLNTMRGVHAKDFRVPDQLRISTLGFHIDPSDVYAASALQLFFSGIKKGFEGEFNSWSEESVQNVLEKEKSFLQGIPNEPSSLLPEGQQDDLKSSTPFYPKPLELPRRETHESEFIECDSDFLQSLQRGGHLIDLLKSFTDAFLEQRYYKISDDKEKSRAIRDALDGMVTQACADDAALVEQIERNYRDIPEIRRVMNSKDIGPIIAQKIRDKFKEFPHFVIKREVDRKEKSILPLRLKSQELHSVPIRTIYRNSSDQISVSRSDDRDTERAIAYLAHESNPDFRAQFYLILYETYMTTHERSALIAEKYGSQDVIDRLRNSRIEAILGRIASEIKVKT